MHEVKHDGYRTLLAVQRGSVVAYTRNGFDWTDRYPRIAEATARLRCKSAILDGEVVVQDAKAHPTSRRFRRQSSLGVTRSFSMRSTFCILMGKICATLTNGAASSAQEAPRKRPHQSASIQ